MALQTCFALSNNHNLFEQKHHSPTFTSPKTLFSISITKVSSSTPSHSPKNSDDPSHKEAVTVSLCLNKRRLNLSILALLLNGSLPGMSKTTLAQELELERYTDSNEGFTFLRPSSWIKKAGATVLFEEANKGSNNVGVVVNPVRLTSLGEFGSPQFVADKLIQAEKRKESTKDAEVIGVAERSGQGALQVYEFEYKIDSTRGGMKRIFTAAFVASKKLYLMNIAYSDKPESPLDTHTRMILEQVLHSFNTSLT